MEERCIQLWQGILDKLLILIPFHYAVRTIVYSNVLELEFEELVWVLILEVARSKIWLQVSIRQILHVLNISLSNALRASIGKSLAFHKACRGVVLLERIQVITINAIASLLS